MPSTAQANVDNMSTDDKVIDSPSGETSPPEGGSDIDQHESVNEKALLRKLDAQLLPAVGILYLLSFLDRSNGKFFSPNEETHIGRVLTRKSVMRASRAFSKTST